MRKLPGAVTDRIQQKGINMGNESFSMSFPIEVKNDYKKTYGANWMMAIHNAVDRGRNGTEKTTDTDPVAVGWANISDEVANDITKMILKAICEAQGDEKIYVSDSGARIQTLIQNGPETVTLPFSDKVEEFSDYVKDYLTSTRKASDIRALVASKLNELEATYREVITWQLKP